MKTSSTRKYVSPEIYLRASKLAADYSLEHGYLPVNQFIENKVRQSLGMNPKFSTNPKPMCRVTLTPELSAVLDEKQIDIDDAIAKAIA